MRVQPDIDTTTFKINPDLVRKIFKTYLYSSENISENISEQMGLMTSIFDDERRCVVDTYTDNALTAYEPIAVASQSFSNITVDTSMKMALCMLLHPIRIVGSLCPSSGLLTHSNRLNIPTYRCIASKRS